MKAKELVFADGARAGFDLLLHAPPHRAPAMARDAGLTGPDGWVAVDPGTLRTPIRASTPSAT